MYNNRVSSVVSTVSYLYFGNNSSAGKTGTILTNILGCESKIEFSCVQSIGHCDFWEWLFKRRSGRGFPPLSVKMSSRLYPDYQLGLLVFIMLVRYRRMKEWDELYYLLEELAELCYLEHLNPDWWYIVRDREVSCYQKLYWIYRQVNFTQKVISGD